MKLKSLKTTITFLLLGVALIMPSCPSPLQKRDQDSQRGGITGTVLSIDGADNSGITVTAEATDGIRSLSVQRALSGESPSSKTIAATATTDANGAYVLKDLPPGTYALTATSKDALERAATCCVQVSPCITVEAALMRLTRTGLVSGTVRLADAASPLGAVVFIAGSSYSAMAAADGSYTMSYVPAGSGYTLVASKTGYESAITSVSVQVAKTTTVAAISLAKTVEPVTTGSVSGSVVSSEGPAIQAAFVFLEGSQYICVSNESGDFILEGVKPGDYTLTASKQGYAPSSIPVSASAGVVTAAGILTLNPAPVANPEGPFYVTYDANGATSGTVPVDTTNYMGGYRVTVLGNSGNLHNSMRDLMSWNTQADGTGTSYTQGQTFIISASTTLFAQYDTSVHIKHVEAGDYHTMILDVDGNLWATGENGFGKLGDGTFINKYSPVPVMSDVTKVSAGRSHTMILKTDGSLWATGDNFLGQFGDGTWSGSQTPVQVMSDVAIVSGGAFHTMILKTDRSLWVTGNTKYIDTYDLSILRSFAENFPVQVMNNVAMVSAGAFYAMMHDSSGGLWVVGADGYRQFGVETTGYSRTPVKVMSDVAMVSAGDAHTMIIKADGSLWATGANDFGQLGDGTNIDRYAPVPVMSDVAMVSVGEDHSMILKTDGSLWATGANNFGQLGDGTTGNRNMPVQVMSDVAMVSAGRAHTMIIKTDGSLWAAGYNIWGQLGDGTTVDKNTPVPVM